MIMTMNSLNPRGTLAVVPNLDYQIATTSLAGGGRERLSIKVTA